MSPNSVISGTITSASHSPASATTTMSSEHAINGSSLSVTVTVNEHSAEFPESSVAVTVTVVVPTGKRLPDAWLYSIVTSDSSEILASKFTTAPHWPSF